MSDNYYAVPASGSAYCSEHKPDDAVEVPAGHCYISTLPYAGATALSCDECGCEVWRAEVTPFVGEMEVSA